MEQTEFKKCWKLVSSAKREQKLKEEKQKQLEKDAEFSEKIKELNKQDTADTTNHNLIPNNEENEVTSSTTQQTENGNADTETHVTFQLPESLLNDIAEEEENEEEYT